MAVTCKATVVIVRRKEIINLIQTLMEKPHKPQNKDEVTIQTKFDKYIRYAKTVNIVFNEILFFQFFGSIIVLCTSVYFLSKHIKDLSAIIFLLMYTVCMFAQIFVYCWAGNEVILKSANTGEAIYCMDWPSLSVNEKKELMMIMARCEIPIQFTSSFLVTMSLQSYGSILKTSYSAFNLLQK
ncbi:hypothetical protein PUN28_012112 [Cardiocondyla obscurior]|uniref:Uncharacterized protein n=1 Tax=Cardiocondyla obscurior TaxID=286306 RepID=A0AAW2FDS6_9HYME